jgi:hypothetical protein
VKVPIASDTVGLRLIIAGNRSAVTAMVTSTASAAAFSVVCYCPIGANPLTLRRAASCIAARLGEGADNALSRMS